jgi:hypothetical protein
MLTLAPVQIAYHVPDPAEAAHELAARRGWGPFFLIEHIPLARCLYRGAPAALDHSSAYGQAGDVMIELITQHNAGPSALRDLFAMIDTSRELGHMLELYERASLAPFYAMVREAARGWDGSKPLRRLG